MIALFITFLFLNDIRRDRAWLPHGIGYQKAYNSINIENSLLYTS